MTRDILIAVAFMALALLLAAVMGGYAFGATCETERTDGHGPVLEVCP